MREGVTAAEFFTAEGTSSDEVMVSTESDHMTTYDGGDYHDLVVASMLCWLLFIMTIIILIIIIFVFIMTTRTRTRTHTHAHARTRTHTHARTHAPAQTTNKRTMRRAGAAVFVIFFRLLYLTKNFDVVCIFSSRSVFFVFCAMAMSGLGQK